MNQEDILKYIRSQLSDKQKAIFRSWVRRDEKNMNEYAQLKNTWALYSSYISASKKENEEKAYSRLLFIKNRPQRIKKMFFAMSKYAALFIITLGLSWLINHYNQPTAGSFIFETPRGQMANVELPDGTTVTLNSGTTISFAMNQGKEQNRVVFLNGEAFFDVATNDKHPFIVKTSALHMKVYGTSFNISAYNNDPKIETVLTEGSLGIMLPNGKELTKIVPQENATYNHKNKTLKVKTVNTDDYISWQNGYIILQNKPLIEFTKKLERWYNVTIKIENAKLANVKISGTILKNKPIEQVLEVLMPIASFEYTIKKTPNKPDIISINSI